MHWIRPERSHLKITGLILILFFGTGFLVACVTGQIQNLPETFPTPLEISTATQTPTIVWFPPTATFTPIPTRVVTPTLDVSPRFGDIILQDDFNDPAPWALNEGASSSIALGEDEITLAIHQPGLYLFTLRNSPVLTDFYMEITASTSLCKGEDEYGVLFRISPSLDFFRYSLTCDGQIRLDKYVKSRASSPQPKIYSGAVPPGAPSSSRLGIWASGKEMRFFVNGEYQFSVNDPSILSGSLGLFARSIAENAVTISFSDLVVYQIVR